MSPLDALASALPGAQELPSVLGSRGPQAGRIEALWWVFFAVSAVVWVAVMVALAGAILRRRVNEPPSKVPHVDPPPTIREAPSHHPFEPPPPARERRMALVIGGCVALTAVILVGLLTSSVITGNRLGRFAGKNPVTIDVIGHQWWWEFEYVDDTVQSNRVKTANELHIPAGEPVLLRFSSHDVIHSFWVPQLHGKRDLIPDQTSTTYLQADAPGEYRGQCAEFCGQQHALMALWVIAEPRDRFDAWLEAQKQARTPPSEPTAVRGEQVFLSRPCVMCHTIRGTPAASRLGPDLTHLASRKTLAAGTIPNTRGHLAGWLLDSQGIKPGNRMPPNPLPADELDALLAYLEGLK